MTNYRFTFSYDGTRYHGWESKTNADTVEGRIEAVLSKMVDGDNGKTADVCRENMSADIRDTKTPAKVDIHGAGRTDAGVHARAMVASGRLNTDRTPDEIKDYLNRYLPADICALDVTVVGDRFHARLNATGKIYEYTLYVGSEKPVFDRNYVWCVPQGRVLDVDAMKKAASYLVGKHDFRSFCGNNKMKKSTVRTIYDVEIVKEGDYVRMRFHGNGFLQNMVRILTGTLVEIGYGHIDAEHMPEIIAGMDRQLAGPTAPPHGLCLLKVEYD